MCFSLSQMLFLFLCREISLVTWQSNISFAISQEESKICQRSIEKDFVSLAIVLAKKNTNAQFSQQLSVKGRTVQTVNCAFLFIVAEPNFNCHAHLWSWLEQHLIVCYYSLSILITKPKFWEKSFSDSN